MNAWFLAGPTATGKTAVAHLLAEECNAVILCADAMTVYRGLDIGTAKPDAAMRSRVAYYGLDLIDPDRPFSVGAFREEARRAAQAAEGGGRPLIVVGGSGLYLAALLKGLDPAPASDPAVRERWEAVLSEQGIAALQDALRTRYPSAWAALADPQNARRLIRALERAEAGVSLPNGWRGAAIAPVATLAIEPALLKRRIAVRARTMVDGGLLDEAARIRARWPALSRTARHAIGYEEAFAVLDGGMTPEQSVERITARTWQLARRQMTWFRHQLPVSWIPVGESMTVREAADAVRSQWEKNGPHTLHL